MTQPTFVPISEADQVRPARHLHVPEAWTTNRPGRAQNAHRARGRSVGTPGPDAGFALRLARRFAHDLKLTEGETEHDVLLGGALIAARRAALFGRGPSIYDVQVALALWGFLVDDPPANWSRPAGRRSPRSPTTTWPNGAWSTPSPRRASGSPRPRRRPGSSRPAVAPPAGGRAGRHRLIAAARRRDRAKARAADEAAGRPDQLCENGGVKNSTFALTDEQRQFRDTLRQFAEERIAPHAAEVDRERCSPGSRLPPAWRWSFPRSAFPRRTAVPGRTW